MKGSINLHKLSIPMNQYPNQETEFHRYLEGEDLHRLCTAGLHYTYSFCFALLCFAFTPWYSEQRLHSPDSLKVSSMAVAPLSCDLALVSCLLESQSLSSVPFVSSNINSDSRQLGNVQISLR